MSRDPFFGSFQAALSKIRPFLRHTNKNHVERSTMLAERWTSLLDGRSNIERLTTCSLASVVYMSVLWGKLRYVTARVDGPPKVGPLGV